MSEPAQRAGLASGARRTVAELRRRLAALALFAGIITILVLVVYQGLAVSAGVRAYVGGESLWSKGQKEAVHALYRFALTHDERDYRRYLSALIVPVADRRARIALERPERNVGEAVRWFVIGGNAPADAEDLVQLFLRFGHVSYMRRAIAIWVAGDSAIGDLRREGNRLHALVTAGSRDSAAYRALLDDITQTDRRLTVLEADFSTTLAEGARWLREVTFGVVVLVGAVLVWIGAAVSNRLLRQERTAAELMQRRREELAASERALRESEAQLRQAQKMEAVGRLAGGVAHDFNNLLTVITANLDLALAESPPDDAVTEHLLEARRGAARAALLTRRLLAFSRRQVAQPRVLRLDAVVADVRDMLVRLIGEDVQVTTDLDPHAPAVCADAGQIEQVIFNLVVNARDAMPNGGTLTIRTRSVRPAAAAHGCVRRGTADRTLYTVLEVSDTGIGMDAATRARLFEPFFTTKGDGKGTGLGLSTVDSIVSQAGGYIEVESELGRGATFRIALPACEPGDVPGIEDDATPPARGTETVLLVEDDAAVRGLAREILVQHGYTVVEAANGVDALQGIEGREREIDLIVSDVVMPEMGGRELVHELTARGVAVPVVFVSGYTDDASPLPSMGGHRAVLLQKPFSAARLTSIVRQALDAAHAARSADLAGR
ncbi:MAG: response regulator [Gemmatimonadaceae bacterium]|nr:response regulator [Gemmatimonadaceae bacterium]